MSLRNADIDNAVECQECAHTACHVGIPCEMCNVVIVLRLLLNRTGNGADAIAALNGRMTAVETTTGQHTTQIGNRPTNAAVNTAIVAAVTPVDDKVNTLKTRVDDATEFPIT